MRDLFHGWIGAVTLSVYERGGSFLIVFQFQYIRMEHGGSYEKCAINRLVVVTFQHLQNVTDMVFGM